MVKTAESHSLIRVVSSCIPLVAGDYLTTTDAIQSLTALLLEDRHGDWLPALRVIPTIGLGQLAAVWDDHRFVHQHVAEAAQASQVVRTHTTDFLAVTSAELERQMEGEGGREGGEEGRKGGREGEGEEERKGGRKEHWVKSKGPLNSKTILSIPLFYAS